MSRPRLWSDDALRDAVANSGYVAEVLRKLGLALANGNYRTVRKRINELQLDTTHWMKKWKIRKEAGKRRRVCLTSDILVENSGYLNGTSLKRRLLEDGFLKNECSLCLQKTEWMGKPLVMVLDHINGVHNDNRIENLRMLCPNCNSQQVTFAGRNKNRCVVQSG